APLAGRGHSGVLGGPGGGAGAVAVDGEVAGHGEDPGALLAVGQRPDLREAPPGPQERLLDEVTGQLRVADAAQEVGVHGMAVPGEDPGADGRVIAARGHSGPPWWGTCSPLSRH